jgi:hypothetical protein
MSGDINKPLALSAGEPLATSRFKAEYVQTFFIFSEELSGARRCLKR